MFLRKIMPLGDELARLRPASPGNRTTHIVDILIDSISNYNYNMFYKSWLAFCNNLASKLLLHGCQPIDFPPLMNWN